MVRLALTGDGGHEVAGSRGRKRRLHKLWTIIGVLLCVVLIPLLIINVTLIVKSFTQPEEIPDFMGYKPFIVLSGSMEPGIMTGDLIITKETEPGMLAAGDVIAYRYGEASVITHRIQSITQTNGQLAFVTKGDANNVEDNVMPTGDLVEGKLRWILPGLGNAAMFLQTPMGLMLAAGVPLMLFFLFDLLRRRRADGKEKAKSLLLEEELARMKQRLHDSGSLERGPDSKGGADNS